MAQRADALEAGRGRDPERRGEVAVGHPTIRLQAGQDRRRAAGPDLHGVLDRAAARGVVTAVFTRELFATGHDDDNRAAVKAVGTDDLDLVGLAFRAPRRDADRLLKGLALHP